MRSDHRLWIVLADGEHARVLTAGKADGEYTTLHAFEPARDPHFSAKSGFLHWVADWVDAAAGRDAFDRLAIAAPARALSDLCEALGPSARSRLVGVLAKDLIKVPDHEIPPHLTWDTLHGRENERGQG